MIIKFITVANTGRFNDNSEIFIVPRLKSLSVTYLIAKAVFNNATLNQFATFSITLRHADGKSRLLFAQQKYRGKVLQHL
jgi:hypothetical protein